MSQLEQILIRRNKSEMADFCQQDSNNFDQVMLFALKNEAPLCWRAAWLIGSIIKTDDARVKPFIHDILEVLPYREDGHQRELLKILLKMNLTEDFESILFDYSVALWEQIRKQPSVRCIAFKAMVKVTEKYPDLKNEVLSLTQPHFINPLSPGIKRSLLKSLKALD